MDSETKVDPTEKAIENTTGHILYDVAHNTPVHLCALFGLQQAIMCMTGVLSIPFILSGEFCARDDEDVIAKLFSITIFMCGVCTILQTTLGIRLPIIQGGSHSFIPPIIALMAMDRWKCPDKITGPSVNGTDPEIWQSRLREVQGNIILASITQVVIGCTGLMGLIVRRIGPLTIAPTLALIGLSLTHIVSGFSESHWGIAALSSGLLLMFGLYLRHVRVPIPVWSRSERCHVSWVPIFQLCPSKRRLFPFDQNGIFSLRNYVTVVQGSINHVWPWFTVLLSVGISWLFCFTLTETDVFPSNSTHPNFMARTDRPQNTIESAPWFYFPYPLQFGLPTFSVAGYVGMLAATFASIVESMGDYFATARICEVPPPPTHALNRGIATEGFGSIISGLVGAGHATTSYSSNIAAIGITGVASRRVFVSAGIIMIVFGVVGKFGAVIALLPEPIVGGSLVILLGMVAAIGISSLAYTDMSSPRNMTIFGTSLMLGFMLPNWIKSNRGAIRSGSTDFDQLLEVVLGTGMFVGGIVGFVLDNTVPGTDAERGILKLREGSSGKKFSEEEMKIYEFPYVTKYMRKVKCCSYVPIMPTFDKEIRCDCCTKKRRHQETDNGYVIEQYPNTYM